MLTSINESSCPTLPELANSVVAHRQVEYQPSKGARIQAQLLPDRCPASSEGVELAAYCRPAFQVAGDYYDPILTSDSNSATA